METKDILFTALMMEKEISSMYNTAANEALNQDLKDEFLDILADTHDSQYAIFMEAYDRGFYPTPLAEESKIQELKQQF